MADQDLIALWCECDSLCSLRLEIELSAAAAAHERGLVILSNRCRRGPELGDRLLESHDGYSLYRPLTD